MTDYSLIPTWEQVATMYKYAPGRENLSNEEWAEFRKHSKQTRKELRENAQTKRQANLQAQRDQREFNKLAEENDAIWEEALPTKMITDRSDLPGRNIDILFGDGEPVTESYKKIKEQYPTAYKFLKPMAYLNAAYEQPQNVPEAIMSGVRDWLRIQNFPDLFKGQSDEEKEADFETWFDDYLREAGGGGSGIGLDANPALGGTPFPELAGYAPDWESLKKAMAELKAPEYKTAEYDPLSAIAVGLSNVNWNAGIVPDFSGAVNKMVAMEEDYKKNKAEAENKTSEAKYQTARQNLANALALEDIRAKQAAQNAEIALARWQAMQPKALGGNKFVWRDGAGNLHWEAVDKGGEARTLGGNEALAALTSMDPKMIKNLTPEKIVQMAKKGSLLLQDKSAQVPWMQGFILQANDMLNASKQED